MKKSKKLLSLLLASFLLVGCGEQGPQGEKGDRGEKGIPGEVGPAGQNGRDGVDGKDGTDGKDGADGQDGRGISSISKASTVGNVDTYVIIYTDGSSSSFTVTNGADGSQGIQGVPGQDGKTPVITISEDGYWTVDGVKTSTLAQGPKGNDGVSVVSILKTSSNGLVDTYTITYSNNTTSTFEVTNGAQGEQGIQGNPGADGKTPTISINEENHWIINGVDSGIVAVGVQGPKGDKGDAGVSVVSIVKTKTEGLVDTYTITYSNNTTSTFEVTNGADGSQGIQGVPGQDGKTPVITISEDGYWTVDGVKTSTLAQGPKGNDGVSVVSIVKTKTEGLVDTYTITYSNNTTSTFEVTNGAQGAQGAQGIQGNPGADGKTPTISINEENHWIINGVDSGIVAVGVQGPKGDKGDAGISVVSIVKTKTEGLVDTYTITYSNNTTSEFTVTNGADGSQGIQGVPGEKGDTPVVTISDDGYWVVDGDKTSTLAQGPKGDKGDQGDAGKDGSTILSGTSDPENLLGKPGDFYINTTTYDIFEKGESTWAKTGNIKGLKGDTGVSIEKTEIDENGDLIVTFSNGEVVNAGHVKDVTKYTVNFYCGDDLVATRTVEPNSKVDEPTAEETAGYTITGWHVEGYDERPWVFEGYYADRVTENVNICATFVPNKYQINFTDEKFGKTIEPMEVTYNASFDITQYLEESGYTFNNWVDSNGNLYPLSGTYRTAANTNLRSSWTPNTYIITLDANKGSCDIESLNVIFNETYELPIPTRTNYVFLGWFNGETRFSNNATWKTAENITLTAQWTNTTNTYVFDSGDGTCDIETMVIGWEDPYELPIPTIDKKEIDWEYGFDCWLLDGEPIPTKGDSWIYSNVGKTLVARYKLRDDNEYLESKYSFTLENDTYSLKKKSGPNYKYAYVPNQYNGKNITSIGSSAFFCCSSLRSITIPNSVTSIGGSAFYDCSNLTSITIPNSVTSIGGNAFYYCSSLTSITIPNSVTSVGDSSFRASSSLTIYCEASSKPSGWNSNWNYDNRPVVWGCVDHFEKDGINYGVKNDGQLTVASLSDKTLKNIVIPSEIDGKSVTSIGGSAFYDCSNLTSITIPNSVTSIGSKAFRGCTSLISIIIPSSVTSIGSNAFSGCSSLTIYCEASSKPSGWNSEWNYNSRSVVWGCLDHFEKDGINYGVKNDGQLTVASLSDKTLKNVVIPSEIDGKSVTSIGAYAFYYCSSLTSITIPNSVTSIGSSAFRECTSLTSITIPNSVTSIGMYVFEYCSSLTIYCEASSKPSGWDGWWNTTGCPVVWNCINHFEKDEINYVLTEDGRLIVASLSDKSLTNINIPSEVDGKSVTSIGENAFCNCSSLTSIIIPSSVTSIGSKAFRGCTSLISIIIPSSVTSIGSNAFNKCSSLTIYCEVSSKPSGWDSYWNNSNRPVVWNYKNNL